METLKVYDKKLIARIHFLTDYDPNLKDSNSFVQRTVSELGMWNAGFENREYLVYWLRRGIFARDRYKKLPKNMLKPEEIYPIIKNALIRCHKILPTKTMNIFVFPTFSSFVKNRMGGCNGITPWKNHFYIYLTPNIKKWKNRLPKTISHEYNHAAMHNYFATDTLLENIIFEGMAEKFREEVVGGGRADWSSAVSMNRCKKLFLKLKNKLYSKNFKLRQDVMFGSKTFPHWFGYSLGYYVVEEYIKRTPKLDWKKRIKIDPSEILKRSEFIT